MIKKLFKFREVLYVVVILVLARGWIGSLDHRADSVPAEDSQPQPVVVIDSTGRDAEQVVERARTADKPRGVVERVTTKELKPDSIIVSVPPRREGVPHLAVPGTQPRVVPSVPLDLPEWGIEEVEKEDRRLVVTSLNFRDGSANRHVYTLGSGDSDFTIRSGNVPSVVRQDREINFLRLGVRLTAAGGVNAVSGEPVGQAILNGPISVGSKSLRISPAVTAGIGDGIGVGVSATLQIGDL